MNLIFWNQQKRVYFDLLEVQSSKTGILVYLMFEHDRDPRAESPSSIRSRRDPLPCGRRTWCPALFDTKRTGLVGMGVVQSGRMALCERGGQER